ncbi:hypothetical protein [Anaeromyxobacter oryzae]|uniref:HK97 gp10 family phage protein n=1 Tax=Anaeromyxobacter oryzae TaxID=2918170 RepID=A0ABN6MXX7_9BACT|nr:hypothetical protein [Anaeromyxobacter oryzae]BDG04593.1 hypothetical protein AMOR_35890 [Anaeromyxobacter oryzae]
MPRPPRETSIDSILRDAADRVVQRVSAAIAKQVSDLVQEGIQRELASAGGGRGRRNTATRRPRTEITKWVADHRARRVPNFVIEATGLDTKRKIVAKFGEGAAFEKGKPLPKPKAA